MAEYLEVGKAEEIGEGQVKAFKVRDKDILVAKYKAEYYAMGRCCTHRGADLSQGSLEGKIITCPRHGSRFDITTGESISGPKIGFLKLKTKDGPSYDVIAEGGIIKVRSREK